MLTKKFTKLIGLGKPPDRGRIFRASMIKPNSTHLFFLPLLIGLTLQKSFSQRVEYQNEVVQLIENRSIYLNGGLRASFGGKSRTYIKIDLPPNTVEWYYSFTTTEGPDATQNLELAVQLSSYLVDPSGMTSTIASSIDVPEGVASADIYLLDYQNNDLFLRKVDLNNGTFYYSQEGTVENTKQAVVEIDDITTGTWYLGLKNPSTMNGINLNIEVVAITETRNGIKTSKEQQKANLYGNLGWKYFENGDYEKCIEYCDKSFQEYEIGIFYANKGLALLMIGKEAQAIDNYIKAITLIKEQPNKEYYLNGAIKDLDNALSLNPHLEGADEIRDLIKTQR